ncbi:MAG TPA: hypothetical protein PKE45_20165 [Caldilineaceae bacterium]|nr:hypothetical protein [Caldilineaceae bacterium]
MSYDPDHTRYLFEEYERRVSAHLLERAALRARAERANAMAQLADRCTRPIAGLATRLWQWGRSTVHWAPPSPGEPYECAPNRKNG